jgi:hypothetical protein
MVQRYEGSPGRGGARHVFPRRMATGQKVGELVTGYVCATSAGSLIHVPRVRYQQPGTDCASINAGVARH